MTVDRHKATTVSGDDPGLFRVTLALGAKVTRAEHSRSKALSSVFTEVHQDRTGLEK